jgi:hypothetical protein
MKKTMIFTAILMMIFMVSCEKPTDDPIIPELTCSIDTTNVKTNGGADGTITVNILTGTPVFNCTFSKDNLTIEDRPMGS